MGSLGGLRLSVGGSTEAADEKSIKNEKSFVPYLT